MLVMIMTSSIDDLVIIPMPMRCHIFHARATLKVKTKEEYFRCHMLNSDPSLQKTLQNETRHDPILSKLPDLTMAGWPKFVANPDIQLFCMKKDQLSTDQGCVL